MIVGLVLPQAQIFSLPAEAAGRVPSSVVAPKMVAHPISAAERAGKAKAIKVSLNLPDSPSDLDLFQCRAFAEPLVPMPAPSVQSENNALAAVIKKFKASKDAEDFSALKEFVTIHPDSRWRATVELNIGLLDFRVGYLTDALKSWASAWELSKTAKQHNQVNVAERAVSELVQLEARLGRTDELKKNLAELKGKKLHGSSAFRLDNANQGLSFMQRAPEKAFKCGPYAVNSLLQVKKHVRSLDPAIKKIQSTNKGTNLQQVCDWANQFGLDYQIAKRDKGASIPTPCVFHWRVGHFAAITEERDGRFKLLDPTFDADGKFTLSHNALETESDGYFVIPAGPLPAGWHSVSKAEAQQIWGKGHANGYGGWNCPGDPKPSPQCNGGPVDCGCNGGMTKATFWTANAELNLSDIPLSYKPPIGPSMDFLINYNEIEGNQPATFAFSNLSANWSLNWISHLKLDGSNNATVSVRGGGYEIYYNSNGSTPVYTNAITSQALLVYISSGVFQRQLPDGSIEVFNLSDSSGDIFLTEVIDPRGNATTISYNANFRVTGVTDPNGNTTTFSYVSNTVGNSGYYLIAGLTDPFLRTAMFTYDSTNTYLLSITDAVGIVSSFTYEPGSSVIESLQTPYGITSLRRYTPMGPYSTPPRGLIFQFPDGTISHIENYLDEPKKTYYWDREAMALYPNDWQNNIYVHATTFKWLFDNTGYVQAPVLHYIKKPLEAQIAYTYAGQPSVDIMGTSNLPLTTTQRITGANVENAVVGGTVTAGDGIYIDIDDVSLNDFQAEIEYTVKTGDTLASVAAGLAASINNYIDLQSAGITATSTGTTLHIISTSPLTQTYAWRNNGGTETLTFSANSNLPETAGLTGTITAADVLTLTATDSGLPGGSESVSYTVIAGDSFGKISTRLASLINADTNLQTVGITATTSGDIVNILSYSCPSQLRRGCNRE
jgi:YD repeat-containing protein